jgi:ectoine hydroxylase
MSARDRRDKAEMRTEDVLTSRPTVLTEAQRAAYFSDGFLILPDYVPRTWLERLCAANDELLERSRRVVHPDSIFVLEERHSAQHPRLHRVSSPQDQHPTFWDFMCDPIMTDLAADVVGPDVKFHHAKLNVKSERGHTRVQVASGHPDEVAASIPADMVATATGGPGTTVLLNCRTIHGSGENRSDRARPLLLPVYSSADSFPLQSVRLSARILTTLCADTQRVSPASTRVRASYLQTSALDTILPGWLSATRRTGLALC